MSLVGGYEEKDNLVSSRISPKFAGPFVIGERSTTLSESRG
jgi:hypothetical protein